MNKFYSSASRIVLVIMAAALVTLTVLKIVEGKDFIMLCGMVFGAYFSRPTAPSENATTTTVTVDPPTSISTNTSTNTSVDKLSKAINKVK